MKRRAEKCLKEELAKKHACYVLITCDAPSNGKMQVEMSYEGDATLAAYILQGAQMHMDEQEMESSIPSVKQACIHYLEN